MDYSKTFSIGDLKASSISAYAIDESKTLESHCFAPDVPNHHLHRGGKAISDADWPDLKPVIHRLYIVDNFPFLKVKEVLNSEFGYNITKRQFTRKVETWGFKKNFRKNERDEIVKSGKIPQRFIHDSRMNQKRVERLQKRNVLRMGLRVESEDDERSLIGHQNAALDDRDMIIEEIPRSELRHDIVAPNNEDQWPFSQSAEYDSGLSWLAVLFVQLEIAEIIASTSFETEKQWDVEEARFISGTDLKELSKAYDNTLVCVRESFEEAIVCLKGSLKLTVELYGWDDPVVYELFKGVVECYEGSSRHDEALKFYEKLLEKWRILVETDSSITEWIKDIGDRIHKVRGGTRGDEESIPEDDDNEEYETGFEDTEMENFDISGEENDSEAQFESRGPSLDDIFNTE
ncbi:hypothetical protein BPAE_0127g00190 [Botrytis paeoniae]|uniref:Clr5 domain-containing protein n=1 Tax=Botrytis paeoniae TaxID=278948 RepID=A0A4Z1FKM9_9HELO|nr:hypothetical protein BPAE_0127g00190 [Botrytis paeoniae]